MKKIKVVHNRKKCIGCNSCVEIAPQSWVMDDKDGKSRLVGAKEKSQGFVGEVFECDKRANELAAEACPVKIIRVE